jgi:hypothetical protein
VNLSQVISALLELVPASSLEGQARDTAVELLRSALANAGDRPSQAIADASMALNAMNDIAVADMSPQWLTISRWLQQVERQWCAAQAHCSPAVNDATGICGVSAP